MARISCLFVRCSSKPVRNNAIPICAATELLNCTLRYSDRGTVLRSSAQILLSSETNRYFPSLSLDVLGAVVGYGHLEVFRFKSWNDILKYSTLTWRIAGCVGPRAGPCVLEKIKTSVAAVRPKPQTVQPVTQSLYRLGYCDQCTSNNCEHFPHISLHLLNWCIERAGSTSSACDWVLGSYPGPDTDWSFS